MFHKNETSKKNSYYILKQDLKIKLLKIKIT